MIPWLMLREPLGCFLREDFLEVAIVFWNHLFKSFLRLTLLLFNSNFSRESEASKTENFFIYGFHNLIRDQLSTFHAVHRDALNFYYVGGINLHIRIETHLAFLPIYSGISHAKPRKPKYDLFRSQTCNKEVMFVTFFTNFYFKSDFMGYASGFIQTSIDVV